ncbi:hypothetical protein BDV35DRAFT_405535 [Aspergillus flavus]|uniref:FAD linked oxidase N-terminal domain-containing protein n=1 Tax=Aspergillus flavus TaxID=5059 RepID=A0A5N6GZ63_ASPFL|nr:hypothetical protein BDV35DRAFT_405535 [Aspergillus flavus]
MALGTAAAVDQFRTAFPGKVVTPEVKPKYQGAVTRPWSQTCWTPAAGYVYLSNVQELTEALAIVKKTGSKFAIRKTGHNPNAGFSSADETAIVLDIRQFQSKELTSDGVARAGSGNTWARCIVTRFDLETHPLINVQYTINLYSPDDHVEINKATVAVQKAMEDDPKTGRAVCSVTTQVSQELYEEVYKSWTEVCKTLPAGCVLHYTIQPMGKAGVEAGKDRGENIMGHESIPQCWWVFTCEWPQEGSDDAVAQQAVNKMSETVHSLAREAGLLLDFKCMSFSMASQRVLGSYGAENIKRMQEAAAKYDPEGVFQKLQYGGFLLRNNV